MQEGLHGAAMAMMVFLACANAASAAPAHAAVPACAATQLRLSADGRDGDFNGMSHGGSRLSIRNLGRDCMLPARSQVLFYGADGKRIAVHTAWARGKPPERVRIAAGHRAAMEVRWVSSRVYSHSRGLRAAWVGVRAGTALLRTPLDATLYGASGRPVEVRQTPLRAMEGMAADQ